MSNQLDVRLRHVNEQTNSHFLNSPNTLHAIMVPNVCHLHLEFNQYNHLNDVHTLHRPTLRQNEKPTIINACGFQALY